MKPLRAANQQLPARPPPSQVEALPHGVSVNQNELSWLNSRLLICVWIIGAAEPEVLSLFWDFLNSRIARNWAAHAFVAVK
jgi:hypothetical protein